MSETVHIPQLRFPEFNGGWKESRIGKIYKDLRTGSTPSRAVKSYFKGDNPWITSGELKYNRISTTFEQISDEAIKDTNLVLYQPGTLFIAITGLEAPGTRGKCAINAVPSTTNQSCLAFRKVDSVDTIYMFYWYLKYGKPLYFKYAQGTKQQSFNNKIVEKFQIFLPNKPEQQKIAAFLTAVDNKIEQLSKKQELLDEYKKGLMQQIFSQAIRFKADDDSEFPDWEEKKLGGVVDNVGGTALEKYTNPKETHKFISIGNYGVDGKYIDNGQRVELNNKTKTKLLDKDNLVMVLNDKTAAGNIVGSTILIDESDSYIYNQRSERLICKSELFPIFAWHYLNSKIFRKSVYSISQGGTQIYVNFPSVKELNFSLPSLLEQTKIAIFLSSIDTKIEQVGKQLDESKQFKKALLQQMFI